MSVTHIEKVSLLTMQRQVFESRSSIFFLFIHQPRSLWTKSPHNTVPSAWIGSSRSWKLVQLMHTWTHMATRSRWLISHLSCDALLRKLPKSWRLWPQLTKEHRLWQHVRKPVRPVLIHATLTTRPSKRSLHISVLCQDVGYTDLTSNLLVLSIDTCLITPAIASGNVLCLHL